MSGAIGIDLEQFGKQIGKAVDQKRKIVFFLGAGCSWPVIPLARDIVNDLRKTWSVGENPLLSFEQLNYEFDVTRLLETNSDRQEHFRTLCKDATPTKPQTEFVKLIRTLRVPLVLTTNFDSLLERELGKADIDHEVCNLGGGQPVDLRGMLAEAEAEGRLLVVKLLGSVKGKTVHFNMQNGGEVGKALAASLQATTRMVVAGYSGAESGVATMFSALFRDGALSPKNLYWCAAPNEGPPYKDPRNVVFSAVKEKFAKWVKDASFAAAVVQLGGDGEVLADDVERANDARTTAAAAPLAASTSLVGHASKKRRIMAGTRGRTAGVRLKWNVQLQKDAVTTAVHRLLPELNRYNLSEDIQVVHFPEGATFIVPGGYLQMQIAKVMGQGAVAHAISLKAVTKGPSLGGLRVLANELVRIYTDLFCKNSTVTVVLLWPSQLRDATDLNHVLGTAVEDVKAIEDATEGGDTAHDLLSSAISFFPLALSYKMGSLTAEPSPEAGQAAAAAAAAPASPQVPVAAASGSTSEPRAGVCTMAHESAFDAASSCVAHGGAAVKRWIGTDGRSPQLLYTVTADAERTEDLLRLMEAAAAVWTDDGGANVQFCVADDPKSAHFEVIACVDDRSKKALAFFPHECDTLEGGKQEVQKLKVYAGLWRLEPEHQRDVVAHELGHILGLAHNGQEVRQLGDAAAPTPVIAAGAVSVNPRSIMRADIALPAPDGQERAVGLDDEDILAVRMLYGTPVIETQAKYDRGMVAEMRRQDLRLFNVRKA